jgi:DNA invertase Pin-like site-specific DNA recombinase
MAKIGYVRVSDDEQDEALQLDALEAVGCTRVYIDHGISGIKTEREELDKALAALKCGDTFIVWKFDRLGRSTIHLLMLFDSFLKRGIHFISITQGIDTTSIEGRIFFGLLALFAEYERELIIQRTKAGMQAAKKRGKHVGRPRKITSDLIANIKLLKCSGRATHHEISTSLGISSRTISRALNG